MERQHFYKYINITDEDKRWGLFLRGTGTAEVSKIEEYPLHNHAVHHYFNYYKGRTIENYQLLYIVKGEGILETELTENQRIKAGDIFILFPGVWHRFRPDNTGWDEFWIEINGSLIKHFQTEGYLNPYKPVFSVGVDKDLIDCFTKMIDVAKEENLAIHFIATGIIFQILGKIFAIEKYKSVSDPSIEIQIKQAKISMINKIVSPVSPKEVADEVGLGYSLFRKEFKKFTGFPPLQYQIHIKMNKAQNLLSTTKLSVKKIAFILGFESPNYFCRLFKQKTGLTPADFRLQKEIIFYSID